jgi:hypothetical protein
MAHWPYAALRAPLFWYATVPLKPAEPAAKGADGPPRLA